MSRRGEPIEKPECPHEPADFMACEACLQGPDSGHWQRTPMVREYNERKYRHQRRLWVDYLTGREPEGFYETELIDRVAALEKRVDKLAQAPGKSI